MLMVPHPSTVLDQEIARIIRDDAAQAEHLGKLTPAQLQIAYDEQWFKLLVPDVYGGLETPLTKLVRLQEAISWIDGSVGWVITLCCGAGWFGGFVQPEMARQVFADPQVCLAGSGAVTGEAERIDGGYRITGTWNYASGAHHATHFTANCKITENGQPVMENGEPLVLPFVLDKKHVELLPTWKYIGMVATGSHSFAIKGAQVSSAHSFRIDPDYAIIKNPLYLYPFLQLAEATLAVNLSGMAMHFIDLAKHIFEEKAKRPKLTDAHREILQTTLKQVAEKLEAARTELFAAVDSSWPDAGEAQLKAVSHTSRQLAIAARSTVDRLYPYCGLMAAAPDTEINRVWRDMHTAGQHALLTFPL